MTDEIELFKDFMLAEFEKLRPEIERGLREDHASFVDGPIEILGPVPYGESPYFYPTQVFYNDDGTATYVHHGPDGPTWSETKPQPEHDKV